MVFDGAFAAPRDEDHVADAGAVGFFHGVLDERLVHDGEHFLGAGFGGGQKACAEAGDGEDGGAKGLLFVDGHGCVV